MFGEQTFAQLRTGLTDKVHLPVKGLVSLLLCEVQAFLSPSCARTGRPSYASAVMHWCIILNYIIICITLSSRVYNSAKSCVTGGVQTYRRFLNENWKSKSAIPSCSRYLARVIYKLCLNSWNTKFSQNVTCVCKNILSVKHVLFECPITTELFQKNGYDLNAYNNVRDILYNTDVITSIVKSIVHSPVGKLV